MNNCFFQFQLYCYVFCNKMPNKGIATIKKKKKIYQYTSIRMHNLDIELGVILGIYSGLRLSLRVAVRKHFKIYCPKASKSSFFVGVMIIANCSSFDPVILYENFSVFVICCTLSYEVDLLFHLATVTTPACPLITWYNWSLITACFYASLCVLVLSCAIGPYM